MKYIVMGCRPSYAIVLDEEGRFLPAANLRYEVGQTVGNVVLMRGPKALPGRSRVLGGGVASAPADREAGGGWLSFSGHASTVISWEGPRHANIEGVLPAR